MTNDLRAIAEAATGGNWEAVLPDDPRGQPVPYYHGLIALIEHSEPGALAVVSDGRLVRKDEWIANARYIAAANPSVILALLDRCEKAEAERDALAARVKVQEG